MLRHQKKLDLFEIEQRRDAIRVELERRLGKGAVDAISKETDSLIESFMSHSCEHGDPHLHHDHAGLPAVSTNQAASTGTEGISDCECGAIAKIRSRVRKMLAQHSQPVVHR